MRLPLHVRLQGRQVIIVGAGRVAARRIVTVLDAGAQVIVVAPEISAPVRDLADRLTIRLKSFEPSDLRDCILVIAATDDERVNAQVAEIAEREGVLAVRSDDAGASEVHLPAIIRHGEVVVSVASGDPGRSRVIAARISAGLVDGDLDARPARTPDRGSVTLVGGGPGDPDLITVAGRRAVLGADVLVHDRLAPLALLELLDPAVEVIDASKRPDDHTLTQEQINELLVDRASRGLRVVRLKGGDPYVFGRGSEELIACTNAGLEVQVIPGVTSALAAAASAGIPLTHRGVSNGFAVITGHVIGDLSDLAASGITVVVLMGVATLPALVEQFGVRDPRTPVAIVERAASPTQRITRGTLATIVDLAVQREVVNPAVIVIGEVVDVLAALPVGV